MHAMFLTVYLQLREHGSESPVIGGVSDEILTRRIGWAMEDETIAPSVVNGSGFQVLDI